MNSVWNPLYLMLLLYIICTLMVYSVYGMYIHTQCIVHIYSMYYIDDTHLPT